VPPAPPAPPSPQTVDRRSGETTISWTDGRNRTRLQSRGTIGLNADDTDITSLSDGGYFNLELTRDGERRRVEIRAASGGRLERSWYVESTERPWGADAQAWLARELPGIIRRSAIAAEARVKRILAAKGVNGVLDEITKIDSDWAKRIYFTRLLEQASIDAATARRILDQAGREISSDFELASLLAQMAPRTANDQAARLAYIQATTTIDSDFERRRALTALVKDGRVTAEVAKAALQSAAKMSSDFELASFLIAVLQNAQLDAAGQAEFINAIGTIQSDFERGRALKTLIASGSPTTETVTRALRAAADMSSDFELAAVLVAVADKVGVDTVRSAFFAAVDSLSSDFERHRVLEAVVRNANVNRDTLLASMTSASKMSSDFEVAGFLVSVARRQSLDETVKSAYMKVADGLSSDHERDRALAALARNGR
jgi:hypothetical protein